MIQSVEFRNYKILQNTTLPLGRFTLIIGPNGSGKTTALQSFAVARNSGNYSFQTLATAGLEPHPNNKVELKLRWGEPHNVTLHCWWSPRPEVGSAGSAWKDASGSALSQGGGRLLEDLQKFRIYLFRPQAISAGAVLQSDVQLGEEGASLVAVLDRLRDKHPERYEKVQGELCRWLPEYDRILFDIDPNGRRVFSLRTTLGQRPIAAADLSQGTLFALAILTLSYLPEPPPLIGLEEPDRGIHPRLLRDLRDALYRLSHPESFDERRAPVQVVVTSHSPYFLDLFRDHPDEIVIAEKLRAEAQFHRLTDRSDIEEILADAPLGEIWYSGVLGGVPAKP